MTSRAKRDSGTIDTRLFFGFLNLDDAAVAHGHLCFLSGGDGSFGGGGG